MKSSEFIIESDATAINKDIEAAMRDPQKRRAKLKSEIEGGLAPIVHNVSSTTQPVYTMGDVEALGWMTKEYYSAGPDDVAWARYYHHDAPGPIRVQSGGRSEPVVWEPGYEEERY